MYIYIHIILCTCVYSFAGSWLYIIYFNNNNKVNKICCVRAVRILYNIYINISHTCSVHSLNKFSPSSSSGRIGCCRWCANNKLYKGQTYTYIECRSISSDGGILWLTERVCFDYYIYLPWLYTHFGFNTCPAGHICLK